MSFVPPLLFSLYGEDHNTCLRAPPPVPFLGFAPLTLNILLFEIMFVFGNFASLTLPFNALLHSSQRTHVSIVIEHEFPPV